MKERLPLGVAILSDPAAVLDVLKGMKEEYPILEYHRFVPPQGYCNPNLVQTMFIGSMIYMRRCGISGHKPEPPDVASAALGTELMRLKWPIYAVTPELADALIRTHPPKDMKWKDLEWPIETATFLVPDSAANCAHFLSPGTPIAITIGKIGKSIMNPLADLIFTDNVDGVMSVTLYHDAKLESLMHVAAVANMDEYLYQLGEKQTYLPDPSMTLQEDDYLRQRRVTDLAANLIAFMASGYMPQMITGDVRPIRPASTKKGRERDALFGVRWLGVGYKRKGPPLGGHHASPVVHWRSGHFRAQPHGPGRKLRRPQWIEPTWVMADAETKIEKRETK